MPACSAEADGYQDVRIQNSSPMHLVKWQLRKALRARKAGQIFRFVRAVCQGGMLIFWRPHVASFFYDQTRDRAGDWSCSRFILGPSIRTRGGCVCK